VNNPAGYFQKPKARFAGRAFGFETGF